MPGRLKLRHKVTGEEKGPFWGAFDPEWIGLFGTNEYRYIRSSDCLDKNGTEIFEGHMVSYMDEWPVEIIDKIGRVGYHENGAFVEVAPEWSAYAEVVGEDGALFNW